MNWAYKPHSRMGFSRTSIPSVGCTFHRAAAEKYHFRWCVYLADRAKEGSGRIWHRWAEGSRSSPVREANASRRAGNASLGKPWSCGGLLSARHLFTVSWPCCTVSKPSIFLWGTDSVIKFLNAGRTAGQWVYRYTPVCSLHLSLHSTSVRKIKGLFSH